MSVLCCQVPDFLIGLTRRQHPEWSNRPLALLGADEKVWAVSHDARQCGVTLDMKPHQAQMRCPDIQLRSLDVETSRAEQSAFIGKLAECGLPLEEQSWGAAYLDLRSVASTSQMVQPIASELGKQVHRLLGESLTPTLGWDTGKFTSRAAARYTRPGHMRLVDRVDEKRFLGPLPITLLPLTPFSLQQLDWLGIQTLHQFAHLPATAVWQRFGAEGKLAQKLAQGRDDRPVAPNTQALPEPISFDFDPPTTFHGQVLEAALRLLRPPLVQLAERLEGCRRLRVDLKFVEGSTRVIHCVFVDPVSDDSRLKATLSHQLGILNWPAALDSIRLTLLESAERTVQQLALFPLDEKSSAGIDLAQKVSFRHATSFFLLHLIDAQHPIAARRFTLNALSSVSTV